MNQNKILGIDIGGSGIKGAIVDIEQGTLLTERLRIPTPSPATPKAVAKVFVELVASFEYEGLIGCGFPAIIKNGTALSASNIDDKWINTDVSALFKTASGQDVFIANDADLAGIAELRFGVGSDIRYQKGTVLMITIGTGLGSALFYNGQLVPNTELGQFQLKGMIAERYASNEVRKREGLSWKAWGKRLHSYVAELETLFAPDIIILGGGGSKYFDLIQNHIKIDTTVIPAQLGNQAGIIGAALFANAQQASRPGKKVKGRIKS